MSQRGKGVKTVSGEGDSEAGKKVATKRAGVRKPPTGSAPSSAKRHSKVTVNAIEGITKAAIVRLARRAGVTRLSHNVYEQLRAILKRFTIDVLTDVVSYTEYDRRHTIGGKDVSRALKRQGRPLYSTENP